jgi:hypothetical protein
VSPDTAVGRFREQQAGTTIAVATGLPPAGVYTYRSDGVERLSLLDTEQRQGPTVPATVQHQTDTCWSLRLNFSDNHWQEIRWCLRDGILEEQGGTTYQRFDFGAFQAGDSSVFVCDPPGQNVRFDAPPGDSWTQSCEGRGEGQGTHVTSAGTNTFVGVETLDVGGTPVETLRYHVQRTITGDQKGSEDNSIWYDARNGLPVRITHDTSVASPSPLGDVTYTEKAQLQLTSMEPRT